jgi:hypothetical protein
MRLQNFAAAALLALSLAGCTTVGSLVSDVAVATTSATPAQATTVAEAEQAATLAEQALDLYVKTGNPSPAVLAELNVLVPAVHNTLVKAEQANAAGNSALTAAALAGFNEALAAYNSYATLQGVSH